MAALSTTTLGTDHFGPGDRASFAFLLFHTMLSYHHTSLNLFEAFERYQDQLDANNLLKLAPVEPRYTVNAYKGSEHIWEDWAYDKDELVTLKQIATESGYTVTVRLEDSED